MQRKGSVGGDLVQKSLEVIQLLNIQVMQGEEKLVKFINLVY